MSDLCDKCKEIEQQTPETSNLVAHADRELKLAGIDQPDSDYNGKLYDAVMELVKVFSAQGHSGFSAMRTLQLFIRVADYKTLAPNDHSMRQDVSEMMGTPPGTSFQDLRDSEWFSYDGGKTWFNVNDKNRPEPDKG